MTQSRPDLSVVVPTRNEQGNVRPLVERLQGALDGVDFEVLFVDDSDDDTPRVITGLVIGDPRLDLIHREGAARAGGLSTAVVEGIRRARGSYVCVLDADLQHPPERIPAMLDAARGGADVVVASRYARGGSDRGLSGAGRRLVSRAAALTARAMFTEARRCTDPLSGFFLCRRHALDGIEFRPVGFKILLEVLVCAPGLAVEDVSLSFGKRATGDSKASLRQGTLFLRHLASLFLHVKGSARTWKFGAVGISGLGVFLPLLWALAGPAGLSPPLAFIPAFAASLAWNGFFNWRWTFADQRHGHAHGARGYLARGLASGAAMFAIFAGTSAAGASTVPAALIAAVGAMVINGLVNRAAVHRPVRSWGSVATSATIRDALDRVASQLTADRAYILPPEGSPPGGLPAGTVERVAGQRRALLLVESGHRVQRRSNIELLSTILVPVTGDTEVMAILVVERRAPRGFEGADLDRAMAVAGRLGPLLADTIEAAGNATAT